MSAVRLALRACAGIEDDAERLACYDKAVGSLDSETKGVTARVTAVRQIGHDSLVIELESSRSPSRSIASRFGDWMRVPVTTTSMPAVACS